MSPATRSIAALTALLLSVPLHAATFDEQRQAVAASIETQPESAILSLVKAGIEEGKPTQAIAEARKWLRQNLAKDANLLVQAGRAAELSGDAAGAAALYQQYLKLAEPNAEAVDNAVIAVHVLLRDQLNDVTAAYGFNRTSCGRLIANATVRQFDPWFIAEAIQRGDAIAVADRLRVICEADISRDVLVHFYDPHFRWLLQQVSGYIDQGGKPRMTAELAAACKNLAKAMRQYEELALQLDWAASVASYNLAKLADENAAPPIEEAKALLAKYPHHALWVQNGWAGGGNGPYYRGDPAKYWPHETDAKMAPIVDAAAKLSPFQLADLMRSWRNGYYADRVTRPLAVEAVRKFVAADPTRTNRRNGVLLLAKEWNQHTPAEAAALVATTTANDQEEASLIRAIAAGGEAKDFDKMADALLGPEAWRLDPNRTPSWLDQLWHYAGRPGGSEKRDQRIKDGNALAQKVKEETLPKEAPVAQHTALFQKLWADYRSAQPKIPGVLSRLQPVVNLTPEAVPELLRDRSPEAQLLARDTMASGFAIADPVWQELETHVGVNVSGYAPHSLYLAQRHVGGSLSELKNRQPNKCRSHPLEPNLRQVVTDGLNRKDLEPWQLIAWINMQFPEDNAAQVKLIQELVKSPLWNGMPWEARYGVFQWFGKELMTPAQVVTLDAANPALVCKELLALERKPETPEEKKIREAAAQADPDAAAAKAAEIAKADVAAATAALQSTLDGLRKATVRIEVPGAALENLAALDPAVFSDATALELMLQLIDGLKAAAPTPNFANRLLEVMEKERDPLKLHRLAPFLWDNVNRHFHSFPRVKALTQSLIEDQPSAASALADAGLNAMANLRGRHSYFNRDVDIPLFKSIRGNAAMKMGLVVIPVAPNHPAYPIYQAQGDWITGNEDSAWKLLDANWDAFATTHRELSIPFLMWTLQRAIFGRAESRQEFLVKSLLDWAGDAGSPLTATEKATIELAYGDIALQRGQVRQAHEIFSRTRENPAYAELPIRHQASLRRVRAERISKNYAAALQTLTDLEMERVPEIWTDVRFARAEVYFDREDFDDAKDDIDSILAREPNHADSRILLGKIQLKRQKLMEATEVELGSASGQKNLVPGERLKVTLSDPTLAVSGAGTEIEVVVWANSGDKETFFLRQFGDEKTKFRGEVATALGAPNPADGTLQVIGDDEVFYAYSERFREKMNHIDEKRGGPITIASDATLMASARKLLTEAEQRSADMQLVMEEIGAGANTEAAAKARIAAGEAKLNHERHIATIAKPGNPIHVRVSDPDRSRTPEIDELTVSVSASSGDSVSRVTLKETATHSGIFEGMIPTTGAQASAFAQNSEPGRNPNMVISPNDDYPAWRPTTKSDETHLFTIDLNDNVPIGEMKITAREPGAKLRRFLVQTAMNHSDWTTVASHPAGPVGPPDPWRPSVVVMTDTDNHHNRNERSVYDIQELREHVEGGWITQTYGAGAAGNVAGPSEAMTESIPGQVKWLRENRHHNAHIVHRFRGYFHEPSEVTRRFRLELGNYQVPQGTHPSVSNPPQFLLAVDGRPITDREKPDQLEGEVTLRPGIHHFEIWATGWDCAIGFGRSVRLQANLEDPAKLVDCPDSFFDPSGFPAGSLDHRNSPATLAAGDDGTTFTVKFSPESRTRLLRLVVTDHEGPVPALNKLALTKPDGTGILPVKEDFAELNKNDTLEMLTGDKISVRYVDDRFITKTRERHERFLDVSFTDARAEFADMEPRFNPGKNEDEPYYEKLLRFLHGKPLDLAIHDADMDSTVAPDKVKVSLETTTGTKEYEATETGDSTGIFKLTVTPVSGTPKNDGEIQVPDGGTLTARYLDQENNRPGVPTPRVATIRHAAFTEPQIRLSHATVTPIEGEGAAASLQHGFERRDDERPNLADESVRVSWKVDHAMFPSNKAPEGGFQAVLGQRMYLEILAPQMALGVASKIEVFAQTDDGRRTAGSTADGFDRNVPGTLLLEAHLDVFKGGGDPWRGVPLLPIYEVNPSHGFGVNPELDRFFITVPLILGNLPEFGAMTSQERYDLANTMRESLDDSQSIDLNPSGLVVRPGENVHIGFRYTDATGSEKWATATAKVVTHPAFDLMTEDHRSTMTTAYVGEDLNLRVVDAGADLTDAADTVKVLVQAKSGAKHTVELHESAPHTGIFKGSYQLAYATAAAPTPAGGTEPPPYDVRINGFPVTYGDTIAARYTDGNGVKTEIRMVTISKGADGTIEPFSKKYDDPEIAMRTQFSLAEAYLEVAKRRRKLGENELADLDYITAKQLLGSAMDQFNDASTRAHAEYLLGSLTMEEAEAAGDAETRETRYRAALSRFLNVTGAYSETIHAAKAQYQIATIYERLKEPDIAAQEYVKLAYKYPDSEHIAVSMARLGTHFLKKAAEYEAKAKPLLEKGPDDKDAAFEGEAMNKMAVAEYLKTARIFGRLQERFPTDPLAGQAGLRAGQSFMRANKHQEAVDAFKRVIAEPSYDGKTIRAQAMYWAGMSYQALRQPMAAYSNFKRLTYDFPESEWAAYARGQLSQEGMLNLEDKLELERLESEQ